MILAVPDDDNPTQPVDDCWNRIGTLGDGSCPRLQEHIRCLNCPVLGRAAAALLDRPLDEVSPDSASIERAQDEAASISAAKDARMQSVFAFRIADEWLALPAQTLRRVEMPRPIQPLPHRRNGIVLGIVNVRGALTIAASLADMLNLDRTTNGRHGSRVQRPRMLVTEHGGQTAVFPVDEIEGMVRFEANARMPTPATLTRSTTAHAHGVIRWRDTTVGLLDPDRLFESLAESLR